MGSVSWSFAGTVSTTAHEVGHNFGADHDWITWDVHHNDCHQDSGLMGYGNAQTGWSECSRDYILAYFAAENGLSCLGTDSSTGFSLKLDGQSVTDDRYPDNVIIVDAEDAKLSDEWECVAVLGLSNNDKGNVCDGTSWSCDKRSMNGKWEYVSDHNGKKAYKLSGKNYWLYVRDNNQWVMTDELGKNGENFYGFCQPGGLSIADCTDRWAWDAAVKFVRCPDEPPVEIPGTVSTKSPIDGSVIDEIECLEIKDLVEQPNLNGIYELSDTLINGKAAYVMGEFTFYYNAIGWHGVYDTDLITSDSNTAYVWCWNEDLMACSGQWNTWQVENNEWSVVSSAVTVSECEGTCSYHDCIRLDGLLRGLNGKYSHMGCYNDEAYYCLNGDCDNYNYLCYDGTDYILSPTICDTDSAKAKCTKNTNDISLCTGTHSWTRQNAAGTRWVMDVNAYADTSCAAAMEIEDTSCLEDNSYGESLCVYNNATVWDEEEQKAFGVADICRNNQTFFSHVVYNGSEVDRTYYLHHRKYWKHIDDDVMSSQWVISIDSTLKNFVAWCDESDLMQCAEGKWAVAVSVGDMINFVVDASMAVSKEGCASTDGTESENQSGDDMNTSIIIAIALVIAVVVIGFGVFFYLRSTKKKRFRAASKAIEVANQEPMEEEVEVEVEMETNETQQTKQVYNLRLIYEFLDFFLMISFFVVFSFCEVPGQLFYTVTPGYFAVVCMCCIIIQFQLYHVLALAANKKLVSEIFASTQFLSLSVSASSSHLSNLLQSAYVLLLISQSNSQTCQVFLEG